MDDLFLDDFEACQRRFEASLDRVRVQWPTARRIEYPIPSDEALRISTILGPPSRRTEKLLIFTVGEHGIEGYVGSAMLELFLQEFLPRLDARTVGLLLVHPINPWGMRHRRRTNAHNVDLNRNFVRDVASLDPSLNPDYARVDRFLRPKKALRGAPGDSVRVFIGLARALAILGPARLRRAILLGQYQYPQGLHFGGDGLQEETRTITQLYHDQTSRYDQVLHLDMHTGHGPSDQMTVVTSYLEPAASEELSRRFGYPLVAKADPAEFYSILGDMIDYQYLLFQETFPGKRLYAASFEFGTVGESISAILYSLKAMVLENQLYWYGAREQLSQQIRNGFESLYLPRASAWRRKAMADARQAFQGILGAEGYLTA